MASRHPPSQSADQPGAAARPPLAVRMRPRTLDEVRGQSSALRAGSPMRRLIEGRSGAAGPMSVIIAGPPGTGKTTLAYLVASADGRTFVNLSAVSAGVKEVRAVMEDAGRARELGQGPTVLFLDEIHRFTKAQQDALLPGVEDRLVILVAATTQNPSFSVIAPLLSRSMLVTLVPLTDEELDDVLSASLAEQRGLDGVFSLEAKARQHVIRMAGGDARRALTTLEAAAGVALDAAADGRGDDAQIQISASDVEAAVAVAAVRYDRAGDQHYDVASALIKSMRGSDVDAALHYLARMLEAGEDPRFIARRVVIAASEDIGMADPTALQTAVAAMHAVAQIGMPEARLILAQAVVHNSLAPKSDASSAAIMAAIADVQAGKGGPVPAHLGSSGARSWRGPAYANPHRDPAGVVTQAYLPDDLAGAEYYRPSGRGFEQTLALRWSRLKERIRGTRGR